MGVVGVVGGVGGCWCGWVWVSGSVVGPCSSHVCNVVLFFVCACACATDGSL